MSDKKELLYIATLQAMMRQLTAVVEEVNDRTDLSTDTKNQALRDMQVQKDALDFANVHLIRAFGEPPKVIEGRVL